MNQRAAQDRPFSGVTTPDPISRQRDTKRIAVRLYVRGPAPAETRQAADEDFRRTPSRRLRYSLGTMAAQSTMLCRRRPAVNERLQLRPMNRWMEASGSTIEKHARQDHRPGTLHLGESARTARSFASVRMTRGIRSTELSHFRSSWKLLDALCLYLRAVIVERNPNGV